MLISFRCPSCDSELEVESSHSGRHSSCPHCRSGIHIPAVRVGPGITVGGFELKKELGRGAMGEVYLATQLSMGRDVALKILPATFTVQQHFVDRFQNEVRMAARLDHSNIVTAYEAGEDTGIHFLAMAYIEGEPLSDLLARDGAMDERKALEIVRKIAEALRWAWEEHRLLHRDIKPSNIMLDKRGEPKLLDMGLSKCLTDTGGLTLSSSVVGTPNYMSPEQASGEPELDTRTDMYALGATLYHMLTNKVPFQGSSLVETLRKQVTEPLPDPRDFNPAVSEHCIRLLEMMLAKRVEDRHPGWAALIADLDLVLDGLAPTRILPSPGQSTLIRRSGLSGWSSGRFPRKPGAIRSAREPASGRWMLAVAALLLLALGALAGLLITQQHRRSLEVLPHPAAASATPPVAPSPSAAEPAPPPGPAPRAERTSRPRTAERPSSPSPAPTELASLPGAESDDGRWRHPPTRPGPREHLEDFLAKARELVAAGRTDEALALVDTYAEPPGRGPDPPHLRDGRRDRFRQIARDRIQEMDAALREERQRKVDDVVEEAAQLLLKQDAAAALAVLREKGSEAGDDAGVFQAGIDLIQEVQRMPELVEASLERDVGREVTLLLDKGPELFRIGSVGQGQLRGERVVMSQGKVVGSSERIYRLEQLDPRERIKRLGDEATPALDVMRGLLACEMRDYGVARQYFDRAGPPFGEALDRTLASLLGQP